jgi:hypothetical protein
MTRPGENMKSKLVSLTGILLVGGLFLGACNMTGSQDSYPSIPSNIDPNSLIPRVPSMTQIEFYGTPGIAPPNTPRTFHVSVWNQYAPIHVSSVRVSYQGSQIGSVSSDPNQNWGGGTFQWTPPSAPGEYVVQAISNDGSISASTNVCVVDLGITLDYLEVMNGDTCLPPSAPSSTDAFSIEHANAIPGSGSCNPNGTVDIEFDIYVNDPANQIAYAYIELTNVSNDGGEHTFGLPGPRSVYGIDYEVSLSSLMTQLGGSSTITWTAKVVSLSGQVLTDGPHQLTYTPPDCSLLVPNLHITAVPPIPRFLPNPLPLQPRNPTATPASAADCPPGTYFAPATFRCIEVKINTPKPGGNGGGASQCPTGQTYSCIGITHQTCSCK